MKLHYMSRDKKLATFELIFVLFFFVKDLIDAQSAQ